MLCGWCDTGIAALSPPLCCTETLLFDSKISNFDSSVHNLLSSLCKPWLTGAFPHCFAYPTSVSWQQFFYIGQLHRVFSSELILTHFSQHYFSCAVMFKAVSLLSRELVTDNIFSIGKTGRILQLVNKQNIVECESKWMYNVTFWKRLFMLSTKEEKRLQIHFSIDI